MFAMAWNTQDCVWQWECMGMCGTRVDVLELRRTAGAGIAQDFHEQLFYFEHPHPLLVEIPGAGQHSGVGTPGRL